MVDGKRYSVTDEDKDVCQARAMAIQAGIMEKEEKQKALKLKDAIDAYISSKNNSLSPSTVRVYEIMKKKRFKGIMDRNIWNHRPGLEKDDWGTDEAPSAEAE